LNILNNLVKKPNILIASPNKSSYSETFIKAHIELLNGNIYHVYDGNYPRKTSEDVSLDTYFIKSFRGRIIGLMPNTIQYKLFPRLNSLEEGLKSYIKAKKIDVVLAEYGTTGAEIFETCKKVGVPLIVHFHGFDASEKETLKKYSVKYNLMFDYCSHIIVVSKKMHSDLVRFGANLQKIVLNTYGPSYAFFDLKPNYHSKSFFAVGRFTEKKAPHLTILAFKKVVEKFPEAELIFAGDGLLLPICRDLCYQLKIPNVTFTGPINPEEVKNKMENSFCFLQHSVIASNGDSEGTPVAVLEAQAAALPVISTRHAGIPDVVLDKETGLLVEEGDVEAMANAMIELYEDREKAKVMGEKGKKRVLEHFTMDKHIGKIDEILLSVVGNNA
jgi:glycosyltransferase involved in cell wall biosynthesis